MTRIVIVMITIFSLAQCSERKVIAPKNRMNQFNEFIEKEKFVEDTSIFYPGIQDKRLKPILTEKINDVAKGFQTVYYGGNPTNESFQKEIEKGISSFSELANHLDTEDRERIGRYIEEIMDIVELESSEGKLNKFLYDFDPN